MQISTQLLGDSFLNPPAAEWVPYVRRMGNKLLLAFNMACEQNDLDVASELLAAYEMRVIDSRLASWGNRRREIEDLVTAHHRLWALLRDNLADWLPEKENPAGDGTG